MILSELRDYIKLRRQVSLADIINHFETDEQAARAMLEVWINKGKIHRSSVSDSCGSVCNKCQGSSTELYIWSEFATEAVLINHDCSAK